MKTKTKENITLIIWVISVNLIADIKHFLDDKSLGWWFLGIVLFGAILGIGWGLSQRYKSNEVKPS